MPLVTGPCEPWPLDLGCCDLPDDVDPEVIERWQAVASKLLWMASGRRIGSCEVEVRPCRRSCLDGYTTRPASGGYTPYVDAGGTWRNGGGCGCGTACSCSSLCEVWLPTPVAEVIEVVVDGVVVDPTTYRLDSPARLVALADGECWPSCQNLALPTTEDGTFGVTIALGEPPDEAAIAAVSEFTCELVKACLPNCKCRLPRNVVRRVANGQTVEYADMTDALNKGRTGLYLTDLWLGLVNPNRLPAPPRVLSPDWPPSRSQIVGP